MDGRMDEHTVGIVLVNDSSHGITSIAAKFWG